jgi:hypothetical protein
MYPAKPNEMPRVEVHATEGQEPFTIGSVTGHEEIFELVEKGGDEPAMVQALRFRVRPDAPTNPDENRSFTVRIQLLPFERVMEWTVDLRLLPAVHPVPALLDFGRVSLDHPKPLALRLAAVGARTVQVKQIEVVGQRFVVREPPRAPDMPWSCVVVVNPAVGRTGIITDQIILHTDDPDVPKVIVRARAIIE